MSPPVQSDRAVEPRLCQNGMAVLINMYSINYLFAIPTIIIMLCEHCHIPYTKPDLAMFVSRPTTSSSSASHDPSIHPLSVCRVASSINWPSCHIFQLFPIRLLRLSCYECWLSICELPTTINSDKMAKSLSIPQLTLSGNLIIITCEYFF